MTELRERYIKHAREARIEAIETDPNAKVNQAAIDALVVKLPACRRSPNPRLRRSNSKPPMRLLGVSMVRNEADVVEAFVRHNLTVLDALVVVDHGSIDGTSEILAKLQAEGLPLQVVPNADPAYRQSATMTALARGALAQDNADFVFALDADEFLKLEGRATLERALSEVPAGVHAVLHWLTYVPDAFDTDPGAFGPGHLWWRLKTERQGLFKVGASAGLARATRRCGRHGQSLRPESRAKRACARTRACAGRRLPRPCPVRSRSQLEGKIIVGYLAYLATQPKDHRRARHWGELYAELRAGVSLSEQRLREIACNYGLPARMWQPPTTIEFVEDPVALDFEQRYRSDVLPDTRSLLMRFTETLIASAQPRASVAHQIPFLE